MAPAVVAAALGLHRDEVEWERDARGKPVISAPVIDLRFSVAHTSGLTLVALALGVDVGVDVERLDRNVTDWTLWGQTLTADEASSLPADRDKRNAALLQQWVRREALLKAAGVGLTVEPHSIALTADGRIVGLPAALGTPELWSLDDVCVPGCAAAIACHPGVTHVEVDHDATLAESDRARTPDVHAVD